MSSTGRQNRFLTDVDFMNIPLRTPRYEVNPLRNIPYKLRWRVSRNAVYWFDLKFAQDEGLVFWHTASRLLRLLGKNGQKKFG